MNNNHFLTWFIRVAFAITIGVVCALICTRADAGAVTTHESCFGDIPCSNPKAECILDPWSLLGSGACSVPYEGVTPDTIDAHANP